jgi:hypothetical protein
MATDTLDTTISALNTSLGNIGSAASAIETLRGQLVTTLNTHGATVEDWEDVDSAATFPAIIAALGTLVSGLGSDAQADLEAAVANAIATTEAQVSATIAGQLGTSVSTAASLAAQLAALVASGDSGSGS